VTAPAAQRKASRSALVVALVLLIGVVVFFTLGYVLARIMI